MRNLYGVAGAGTLKHRHEHGLIPADMRAMLSARQHLQCHEVTS